MKILDIYRTSKKFFVATMLVLSVFVLSPHTVSAQVNAQGLGGVLFQCTGSSNKISGLLNSASGRSVDTNDKATEDVKQKESCQDAIARYAISELLAKLTQQTLNWINSGFKGNPSFIQNPQAYFQSIATQEINQLTSLIQFNTEAYPFGRDTARSIILSEVGGAFATRAQYTLNNYVPTGNAADFQADFRVGGWNAFFQQAFQPQNNPVGFSLLASQEKARATAGRASLQSNIQIAQQELLQNGGFLNLKKCEASQSDTGAEYVSPESVNNGVFTEADYIAIANDPNRSESEQAEAKTHICKTWVTETPGSLISHALNKTVIDIPADQAIAADEINESLNVVFTALMNQVFQNGVRSLENTEALAQDGLNQVQLGSIGLGDLLLDPTSVIGGGLSQATDFFGGIGENISNVETAQGNLVNWSEQGGQFDIYNQLPYIIYIHKRYAGGDDWDGNGQPDTPIILPEGVDSTTGESFYDPAPGFNGILAQNNALTQVILELEKLDMCIPGPRVGWEQYVQQRIQATAQEIYQKAGDVDDLGTAISNILDPTGTIGGTASGQVQEHAQKAVQSLQNATEQYVALVADKYKITLNNMPLITPVANVEIRKIQQYVDRIAENTEKRNNLLAIIAGLEYIQDKIDELINLANTGNLTPEEAELQGGILIDTFYSTVGEMITADDLRELQSFATTATAQIGYIQNLVTICKNQKLDPSYTGQTRGQYYTSISGQQLATTPDDRGYLLGSSVQLDWGQGDAGTVIATILGSATGNLSGPQVLDTLKNKISNLQGQNWVANSMYIENIIWPGGERY